MTKKQTKQNADKRAVEATGTRLDNAGMEVSQRAGNAPQRLQERLDNALAVAGLAYGHFPEDWRLFFDNGVLDPEWFYTVSQEEFWKGWDAFCKAESNRSLPDAEHAEKKARTDARIFDYRAYRMIETILNEVEKYYDSNPTTKEKFIGNLNIIRRRRWLIIKCATALVGIAETKSGASLLAKKAIAEFISLKDSGSAEAVHNALDMANEAAKAYFAEHLFDAPPQATKEGGTSRKGLPEGFADYIRRLLLDNGLFVMRKGKLAKSEKNPYGLEAESTKGKLSNLIINDTSADGEHFRLFVMGDDTLIERALKHIAREQNRQNKKALPKTSNN